jgi:hypothetical protein
VSSEILDAARSYVKAGYAVYPVHLSLDEIGKKVPDFPGNWRDSVTTVGEVDELFPEADGIAIDTGKSGIVVIDLDQTSGKDGLANLKEAGIPLPSTPMRVRTWSGGFHGFYQQPPNPVGTGQNKPVRYVDFRGEGGTVFAAPTRVFDTNGDPAGTYTLVTDIIPVSDLPVLDEAYAARIRPVKPERPPGRVTTPGRPSRLRTDQVEALTRFLQDDASVIRSATDGSRNEALGRTTLLMADRCQKLGHTYEEYRSLVLEAYEESGGTDLGQADDWCRSAWTKARHSPMSMPRTHIDEMADQRHSRMLADRLARARLNGETSRFLTSSSFVDWTVPPPEPEYWVSGVIPQGEQVILYGRPEAGKTFTGIAWGMSVALGVPWFGRECSSGRVWFMAGEGNRRITSRMHAWFSHHGQTPDPDRFRLINHVPDLMNEQVVEQLAVRIAEDEVDLVFIDTLGRAMAVGGGDVSSPPDAAMALRSLQVFSKYRPTATPVAIHHPIKEGSMAGAYNLLAGVDVALQAEVDEAGVGELRFAKNKDGEKTTVCRYRWKSVGRSAVLTPVGPPGYYPAEPSDDQETDYDPFVERRMMEEQ